MRHMQVHLLLYYMNWDRKFSIAKEANQLQKLKVAVVLSSAILQTPNTLLHFLCHRLMQ
jgi:uncharacterized Rmd1/YagE family protein